MRARTFPLYYSALLVGEAAVAGTVIAVFGTRPPFTYELGWAAVVSFVAMQLYSLRRRVPALRDLGSLDAWLDAHIFFGLQGFVFVSYHCVGLTAGLELAVINAGVVVALVITGIVGRYLWRHVSRSPAHAIWSLLHRPLSFVLLALTILHVLAHFAYAV